MLKKWFIPLIGLLGAGLARLHGADNKIAKLIEATLWAIPFAYVASLIASNLVTVAVLASTIALMNTGHGQWFSLGTVWKRVKPERLDFIVAAFFGDDPRINASEHHTDRPLIYDKLYFRCVFGMAVKGVARILPLTIVLAVYHPILAPLMMFGGALTALAYVLGFELFKHYPTKYGEYLSGFFAYTTLAIVWSAV